MEAEKIREILNGAEISLLNEEDEDAVQSYRFHREEGRVRASFGNRGRDGWVCAPMLSYSVSPGGEVHIGDGRSIDFTWEQIELADGILTVKCGRGLMRFTYKPAEKKPKRYLP